MIYNELLQRGTYELPIELYPINSNHPKYEMAHHWHNEFEIIHIIKGKMKIRLNRREFDGMAGDIIFVNSQTVHGGNPVDCEYECIVFDNSIINTVDKACGAFISDLIDHIIVVNDHFKKSDERVYGVFLKLFKVMNEKGSYFEVMASLYELFGIILKDKCYKSASGLGEENSAGNAKLKKVLTYIRQSYDAPLTLDKMADVAGMNPKYFCSFFKDMTKKSPVEYLNMYRIEKAARKLLSTDMSVTEIAFSCGFNDLSYFIKTFKKIKGITPNGFRKKGE